MVRQVHRERIFIYKPKLPEDAAYQKHLPVHPDPVEGQAVHGSTGSPRTEQWIPRIYLFCKIYIFNDNGDKTPTRLEYVKGC